MNTPMSHVMAVPTLLDRQWDRWELIRGGPGLSGHRQSASGSMTSRKRCACSAKRNNPCLKK